MSGSMARRSAMACLLMLIAAGCTRQSTPPEQANGAQANSAVANQATADEVTAPAGPAAQAGAVDRSHRGTAAPTSRLVDLDGKPVTLAELRGKPVLVNLWATWCAPCVAELPSLDRAAAGLTAVAVDQGEAADKVRPFLAARKLAHLRPLIDADMAISMGLPANLPTTLLYDSEGKEIWRVSGGRDWSSAESGALLAEASAGRSGS